MSVFVLLTVFFFSTKTRLLDSVVHSSRGDGHHRLGLRLRHRRHRPLLLLLSGKNPPAFEQRRLIICVLPVESWEQNSSDWYWLGRWWWREGWTGETFFLSNLSSVQCPVSSVQTRVAQLMQLSLTHSLTSFLLAVQNISMAGPINWLVNQAYMWLVR